MSTMAKPKDGDISIMSQIGAALSSAGIVKPNQGRAVRQATFFGFWLLFSLAGWLFADYVLSFFTIADSARYGSVMLMIGVAFWLAYRSVNIPIFADFLIGVEAEMRKVTWPTRKELVAGATVVLFVVVSLSVLMFGFDFLWTAIFTWLGVR